MSELVRPTGIRKELYKELQHYCIDHDMKVKEALEKAVEEYLERNSGSKRK